MSEKRLFDVQTIPNTMEIMGANTQLEKENEQLRVQLNLCSDQRNEFHRIAREKANRVGKLEKENEQLKSEINMLKTTIGRNEGYIDRLTHTGEWR